MYAIRSYYVQPYTLSLLRKEELPKGDVLAVACPYCMVMYKDSVKSTHKEDVLEIRDISEVVLEAM